MVNSFTSFEKAAAWSVHIFSASGLLSGFMAIIAISEKNFRAAMGWLLVSLFIDGIDGTFARKFRVKEVLPKMNGRNIDYVVDFASYAIIPAYFFYAAYLVDPVLVLPLSFLILLVSAIYYGKEGMVSDDHYFIGFPVMWNMVVFYLVFIFSLPHWANAAVIIICAILHFVPIKFAYPSRATRLKRLTISFAILFMILVLLAVWFYPNVPVWLKVFATGNLLYFAGLAAFDTLRK